MKQSNSSQRSKVTDNSTDKYFDELKKENYDNTFPVAEQWLRSLNSNSLNKTMERKINHMKNYFAVNKFKLVYLTLFIVFLVGATTMPVTSHETIGDVITFTADINDQNTMVALNNLNWLKGNEITTVNIRNTGAVNPEYKVVIPKESHYKIDEFVSSLKNINGVSDIKTKAIQETVLRSLVSLVLFDVFKINIDATNKSNSEVETEIRNQLREAGIMNAEIQFSKNAKGERQINVKIPVENLQNDGGVDMTIKDGGKVNKIKEVRKIGPGSDGEKSFKDMTDAEIRNKIRLDMDDPGLSDAMIVIQRNGGNLNVKIMNEDGSQKGELKIEEETR